MVWVDRRGREEPAGRLPPRAYAHPRLSPDGRQVAMEVREEEHDIWLSDIASDTLRRLGLSRATINRAPMWMPDGRRIVFTSQETDALALGPGELFARPADGSGTAERLVAPTGIRLPLLASSVTKDGRHIVALAARGRRGPVAGDTARPKARGGCWGLRSSSNGMVISHQTDAGWRRYQNSTGQFESTYEPSRAWRAESGRFRLVAPSSRCGPGTVRNSSTSAWTGQSEAWT